MPFLYSYHSNNKVPINFYTFPKEIQLVAKRLFLAAPIPVRNWQDTHFVLQVPILLGENPLKPLFIIWHAPTIDTIQFQRPYCNLRRAAATRRNTAATLIKVFR